MLNGSCGEKHIKKKKKDIDFCASLAIMLRSHYQQKYNCNFWTPCTISDKIHLNFAINLFRFLRKWKKCLEIASILIIYPWFSIRLYISFMKWSWGNFSLGFFYAVFKTTLKMTAKLWMDHHAWTVHFKNRGVHCTCI